MAGVMIYPVTPVAKPRMTHRDRWRKRPCVLRYRAYADELRLWRVAVPQGGARVVFVLRMPASWSAKKHAAMEGQPHTVKPDADNLLKALLDVVYPRVDARVWDIRATKIWGVRASIEVRE